VDQAAGDATAAQRRPIAITIICVIGFLGIIPTVLLLFSETARNIAPWYVPFLGVSAVVGLASFVGLWMMRRWALYLYTGFAVLVQGVLLATGLWQPLAAILPGIIIAVGFAYVSKMR
jgi:hypothetical protein